LPATPLLPSLPPRGLIADMDNIFGIIFDFPAAHDILSAERDGCCFAPQLSPDADSERSYFQ